MIKKFYVKNYNIVVFNIIFTFSIFFTNILINPILIKNFNFQEHIISYSNMLLSAGLFISTFFIRYLLTFRFNYLKIVNYGLLLLIVNNSFYLLVIYFNKIDPNSYLQYTYILLRALEGAGSNMVMFTFSYILSLKLMRNDFKGTINGLLLSKNYLIKFIAPIMASYIILIFSNDLIIIYVSLLIYFSLYVYTKINYNKIFLTNFKYIIKKQSFIKKKLNLFKAKEIASFEFMKELFLINKINSIFLLIELFIQNNYRVFYDLYMILIFNIVFKLSLVESTFLFSLMIAGNSIGFLISYIYDKLYMNIGFYNEKYQTIAATTLTFLMFALFLCIYKNYDKLNNLYFYLIIYTFSFGFIRNIFHDRTNRLILELSKENGFLENYKSANVILSEVFLIIGYLITGMLFYFGSYLYIVNYILLLSFILILSFVIKYTVFKNDIFK